MRIFSYFLNGIHILDYCYFLNGIHILAISKVKILYFGSMRLWMISYMHIFLPSLTPEGTISSNQKMFSSFPSILILEDPLSFHFRLLKWNEN